MATTTQKKAPRVRVARRDAEAIVDLAAWAHGYAALVLELYQRGAFARDAALQGAPAHAA